MMSSGTSHDELKPVVSKIFCSPFLTTLVVRKRPHVVNGGGFVVADCSTKTIFTVDGCGVIGAKGEVMVRDEDGLPILRIQKKVGVVRVLSTHSAWRGYLVDEEEEAMNRLVFSIKEPRRCLVKNEAVRIAIEPKSSSKEWDFEVKGYFPDKSCIIRDCRGSLVAQVSVKETTGSKEFYQVVVQPGYDQAFVVGVIAVLDNIHDESTRC